MHPLPLSKSSQPIEPRTAMKPSSLFSAALLLALGSLSTSCVTHSHATELNGVAGLRGEPIEYQTTDRWALNFLGIFGLIGDTSKAKALESFTEEASSRGGNRIRITQTSSSIYWWIFPPISFFIHPVVHTVEGDVEGTVARDE